MQLGGIRLGGHSGDRSRGDHGPGWGRGRGERLDRLANTHGGTASGTAVHSDTKSSAW